MPAPAFADTPSSVANLDLSVNILPVISIRTLDSTATSEITELNYSITPTPSGVRQTNTTVVDVATSNVSGYTLYMNSDYRTDGTSSSAIPGGTDSSAAAFTTSLINTDSTLYAANPTIASVPTANTAIASSSSYWNYSKSWNETLGPVGSQQTYTSSSLPAASLSNLLIPAQNTPDTVRSDVDIATDNSKTSISINVNMATDKASGTYQNRLLFTAVANPILVDFTLTFDQNTVDTVTNLPAPLTATQVASQYNFIVPDVSGAGTLPQMVRSGYQFVGWSTSPTTRQGNGSGPDGLYVAGDTYTVLADDSEQIDYTQHGTGSATLYAVWVLCTANHICYKANGTDVNGTMEDQATVYMTSTTTDNSADSTALSSSTTELTLYAPNFSRAGYGFKGWNTKADGSGTMYGPNQTLTTSAGTLTSAMQAELGSTGLVLYAQWVASSGDLQTWTDCSSLSQGDVIALTDTRTYTDSSAATYAVAKLADNKCWMIENMRYKPAVGTETTTFSTSTYNLQQYSLTNMNRSLDPLVIGDQGSPYYQWFSYGGYYSYASAIATTTTNSTQYYNYSTSSNSFSNNGATMVARTATDTVKNNNICPAGWRLPRSAYNGSAKNATANNDFPYLNNALNGSYSTVSTFAGSNKWRSYPNNFIFAGNWYNTDTNHRGTVGIYWSSTIGDGERAYNVFLYPAAIYPTSNNVRYNGRSVRCVYGL